MRLGRALEMKSGLFHFPNSILRISAKMLGKDDIYQRLSGSLQVEIQKTKRLLDWEPLVSVDEGFRRAAVAFRCREIVP